MRMMRRLLQAWRGLPRIFGATRQAAPAPITLPANSIVDEELFPGYDANNFYPVRLGDVYNKRYKIVSKLGFGARSTIWLARDTTRWFWQSHKYVALKVSTAHHMRGSPIQRELEVSRLIRENAADENATLLRPALDHFEIRRPDRTPHQCITHEVLRESLWEFQHRRFSDEKLTTGFVKSYVVLMLRALDFLHTKCNFTHGDLEDDNFLVDFEDLSIVQEYVNSLATRPISQKIEGDRTIYLSRADFGNLKSRITGPKLIDFDQAQPGNHKSHMRHPMQAPAYRAPEVLMGMPWSYSLDIWNIGVLIWNMMEDRDLFPRPCTADGKYDPKAHVAQMIALLGPPPAEFLESERKWRNVPWLPPVTEDSDKECFFAKELWGGPFFDDAGRFLYEEMIPKDLRLFDTVQSLDEDDKALFMDFATQILKWVPEHRKTAKELLAHPWLDLEAEARRFAKKKTR